METSWAKDKRSLRIKRKKITTKFSSCTLGRVCLRVDTSMYVGMCFWSVYTMDGYELNGWLVGWPAGLVACFVRE